MVTTRYFLDSSALIALATTDHHHHQAMRSWLLRFVARASSPKISPQRMLFEEQNIRVFTTPTVEGALIRFLVHQKVPATAAIGRLAALHAEKWHEFLEDSLSYTGIPPTGIIGHKQVTDAYLAEQVRRRQGKLVTLDAGLRQLHPDVAVDPAA